MRATFDLKKSTAKILTASEIRKALTSGTKTQIRKFIQEGVAMASAQAPGEIMVGTGVTWDMVGNIAAGAALTYYGIRKAKNQNISLASTVAGVSILTDKGIDYIKGAMGLRAAPLRLAAQIRATPTFQSMTTAPITAVVGGEKPLLL